MDTVKQIIENEFGPWAIVALEEPATLSGSGHGWGIQTSHERWDRKHRLCVVASTTMTTNTATTDMTTAMTTTTTTGKLVT